MNCIICKISMNEIMLHRINPTGQSDAGWMCIFCMQKVEPELAKNIINDPDYKVIKDIESIVLNK